jgi:hypothetical protein
MVTDFFETIWTACAEGLALEIEITHRYVGCDVWCNNFIGRSRSWSSVARAATGTISILNVWSRSKLN